jgi:hypothetical protein
VLSYVWTSPALTHQSRLLRAAFGSWEVSGILTTETGQPITVTAGQDRSLTGLGQDRAVLVGPAYGPGACKNSAPCASYLSVAGFALPALGTFGNVAKGALRGPGLVNWDAGLFKNFQLVERLQLQFRAEFFNLANHTNLSNPSASVSSGSFGQILSTATDPRIGQLALKILF